MSTAVLKVEDQQTVQGHILQPGESWQSSPGPLLLSLMNLAPLAGEVTVKGPLGQQKIPLAPFQSMTTMCLGPVTVLNSGMTPVVLSWHQPAGAEESEVARSLSGQQPVATADEVVFLPPGASKSWPAFQVIELVIQNAFPSQGKAFVVVGPMPQEIHLPPLSSHKIPVFFQSVTIQNTGQTFLIAKAVKLG